MWHIIAIIYCFLANPFLMVNFPLAQGHHKQSIILVTHPPLYTIKINETFYKIVYSVLQLNFFPVSA